MLDEDALKEFQSILDAFGPSGFEREVAQLVRAYASKYADEVFIDNLGSVMFTKKGDADRPRVLLPGHVDEVGFLISSIDKSGYLTFRPLGGWWDQVLLGQEVLVRTMDGTQHYGVIAAKPPHVLPAEERKKLVKMDKMFIDLGCTSKEEIEKLNVQIGDPVVPFTKSRFLHGGRILASKAIDDRVGAFMAYQVLRILKEQRIPHPNTVVGAATVQEEVGLRGARTTTFKVKPDVALVLEVDIAGDVPGIGAREAPAKMGKGPSIGTYDRSMIPNQPLKHLVIETAKKNNIPHQLSLTSGGTDGGVIHFSRTGVPSIVLGVPTRHIHSHVGFVDLEDLKNTMKLVVEVVKQLDQKTVDGLTKL